MKQGKEMCILYAQGTPEQKRMVQDAIERWWWPTLMMFGLPDDESTNSEILLRWGVKTKTNDTLRQEFVNEMVPEIQVLGLAVPDPDLYYDEASENWIYGEIDWDEVWQVVKGDGPCNEERLGARRQAHEEGQWVREAVAAYAEKQISVQGEQEVPA